MHYRQREQRERFAEVDFERSAWIMDNPVIYEREARMFEHFAVSTAPVLELGVGEGLTLDFVPDLAGLGYIGSDRELSRARTVVNHRDVTSGQAAPARSLVCDASHIPFANRSIGSVICRDLLHHIPRQGRALAVREMARVLKAEGEVVIIEPNGGRSPLIAAFATFIDTERMALEFNAGSLEHLLAPHFAEIHLEYIVPSALYRALLHYRLGWPALARFSAVRKLIEGWEHWIGSVAPRDRWNWICVRCSQPIGE